MRGWHNGTAVACKATSREFDSLSALFRIIIHKPFKLNFFLIKMRVECSFCGKTLIVDEFGYAQKGKGIPIYCGKCQHNLDNGINEVIRF